MASSLVRKTSISLQQHGLRPSCSRPRRCVLVQAFSKHHEHHEHTQVERVLRYPSGETRYIRYPVEATVDEEDDDSSFTSWDISTYRHGLLSTRPKHRQQSGLPAHQPSNSSPSLQETAAYLEGLFAASYEAQPLIDVDDSYQILHGCPWVLPRPLFVLACKGKATSLEEDIRSTYSLRTKVKQEGAAEALAKLLNKQHLANALEVAEMRDGVVAFEHDEDADKFAGMLEEEGHSQVMVAEVDSHKLFRMVSDVRALVVLLPQGTAVPQPYQLAASLKQKKSWDSM